MRDGQGLHFIYRLVPLAAVLALALAAPGAAQSPVVGAPIADAPNVVGGPGSANYELAARWAPYRIQELIHSTTVQPRWIEGSNRFWYEWETSEGTFYRIVDMAQGTQRQIFDNDRIAAELTRIVGDPYDAKHLPIRSIRFIDANTLQFEVESSQEEEPEAEAEVDEEDELEEEQDEDMEEESRRSERPEKKVHYFEYDVDTQTLRELEDYEAPDNHPSWANVSPDGHTVIFARNHDLHMMSGEDYEKILDARRGKSGDEADEAEEDVEVEEIRITEDGEEHYSWASAWADRGDTDKERAENADERKPAPAVWSQDSEKFAMVRSDQREVDELWVIHSVGNERPELETYKYDMPGEENVTQEELWIFDVASQEGVKVTEPDPWQDENLSIATARQFRYPDSEEPRRSLWLADGSDALYYVRVSRDRHRSDVMLADAETGEARPLFGDRMNTYMETRGLERLPNGDLIWWSERDGWAHLYRYSADGTLRNRLTEGPYSVRSVEAVDADGGWVYFNATGREEGEDPYFTNLYRVRLDGSQLALLTPGNYDHRVAMDESARWLVDNHSRVNTVPATVLRDARGNETAALAEADFSRLFDAGWQMPEPFTVKAADGVTDLYGVMYRPFDFDSTKVYPIVEYVYPGPQTEAVSKSFSTNRYEVGLAQFGFVVITVGNRGGHPARSKWYHNYGYGNLRDYGLADKKVTAEQLADRHEFIDLDRVGIYGHSGGGFMSTAAMLVYPDFFDVAVSSSGNHTNDVYNRWWSETHHGVKEEVDDSGDVSFEYDIDTNPELAANLKGQLLLTTGDIDNNVHHANTLRMAEALIKANKRFDYFVFPGQRHGYGSMGDYWFWLRAEYFVEHLLGDDHWNADIIPLQRQQPRR
ncbi:MAG: DPP IV N-terminal domain-containing protein [Longimicrobiales bacterium]